MNVRVNQLAKDKMLAAPADKSLAVAPGSMQSYVAAARQSLPRMGIAEPHDRKTPEQMEAFNRFAGALLQAGVEPADIELLLPQAETGESARAAKRIAKFLDRLDRFFARQSGGGTPQRPRPIPDALRISEPKSAEELLSQSARSPHVCLIQAPDVGDLCQITAEDKGQRIACLQYNNFHSGVRICDLEIEPDYLGRGVANALIRKLAKVVRREHFGESSLSVALVAASVTLSSEALPLLMTLQRVGFEAVNFNSTSNRIDLRWEIRNVMPGGELEPPRSAGDIEPASKSGYVRENLEEARQLGFLVPVQPELVDQRFLADRNANFQVIQVRSAVGTAGYMVVDLRQKDHQDGYVDQTGRILQMGFHPLLDHEEVFQVSQELLKSATQAYSDGEARSIRLKISNVSRDQNINTAHAAFFVALASSDLNRIGLLRGQII